MSGAFPRHFPTLETERLVLRELRDSDAPALFAIFSDPVAMRYWSSPAWTAIEEAHASLAAVRRDFAAGTGIRFAVVPRGERGEGELVGTCTLFRIDAQHRRAEIGYMLRPAEWGRGLMREALAAVLGFAFDELALHRVEADLDPRNEASKGILLRFGFREEGLQRERWHVNGEIQDGLLMGLLAAEWRAARRP